MSQLPPELPLGEIDRIWHGEIEQKLFAGALPSDWPVTVFLGGQPGAGKTNAGMLADSLYSDRQLVHIIGDDYRQFHPRYDEVMETDPLAMPDVTAQAAGVWTGMCVAHANKQGFSSLVEGTWRNQATVLDAAKEAKAAGRSTHAIVLAVPPALSELGLLERFYKDKAAGEQARWTPPSAHKETIENLLGTVHVVVQSPDIDQVSVVDRSGKVLCVDRVKVEQVFIQQFNRKLTPEEKQQIGEALPFLKQAHAKFTPDNLEVKALLDKLENLVSPRGLELQNSSLGKPKIGRDEVLDRIRTQADDKLQRPTDPGRPHRKPTR